MKVEIIIISYCIPNILRKCLDSVFDCTIGNDFHVTVVDNNSDTNTKNFLYEYFNENKDRPLNLIQLDSNNGYGAGANIGIKNSESEAVMLLNNDIIALPQWLPPLEKVLIDAPDVGIVGPKLINSKGLIVGAGVKAGGPHHSPQGWLQKDGPGVFDTQEDVIYCGGASLLMRREMLEELKGYTTLGSDDYFDSRFPFYYEDYDISCRARKMGWRTVYCPKSKMIHLHEGSLPAAGREIRNRYHEISKKLFFDKYGTTDTSILSIRMSDGNK